MCLGAAFVIANLKVLTVEIQGNRSVGLAELVLRRDLVFASILNGHVFYFQGGEVRVAIFVDGQLKRIPNSFSNLPPHFKDRPNNYSASHSRGTRSENEKLGKNFKSRNPTFRADVSRG